MTHTAFLLAAAFGFAWVIGASKLTLWARETIDAVAVHGQTMGIPRTAVAARWILALVECAGCIGFHEGLIYAAVTGSSPVDAVLTGLAVLTSNLILATIVSHI